MQPFFLTRSSKNALPVEPIEASTLGAWLARRPAATRAWVERLRFKAKPGETCLIPDGKGAPQRVLLGVGKDRIWSYAALPGALRDGAYRIEGRLAPAEATAAALGFALGCYRFTRYKGSSQASHPRLVLPEACERDEVRRLAEAIFLVRDLINTPASDMGPEELAGVATTIARAHGARIKVTVGERLLEEGWPAVHAVGRGSARPPRLIDLRWGKPSDPKVTLVGKGVCFDSGGLDIKSSDNMLLMKKDMGGGAVVLALGQAVMDAGMPVSLRVIVPAVENAVDGNSYRPLDVLATRKGLTVEVGNTDAEGRLILCDALAEADREQPALLLDVATLTGAARVALGTELPAVFTDDDELADELLECGLSASEPMWRLPFFGPYDDQLDSPVADVSSTGKGRFGGAILAALFLKRFVQATGAWAHLDVMGWNTRSRPGRPEGGEATGLRACYELLRRRFASS